MKTVLIFDADNTIWDTDAVFRAAQLALLKSLAKAKLLTQPNLQLESLRIIDQVLVNKLGQAEYDFKLLTTALVYFYSQKLTVTEAVEAATAHPNPIMDTNIVEVIEEANRAYKQALKHIPSLYPETLFLLSAIRVLASTTTPLVTILLSEGNYARLN